MPRAAASFSGDCFFFDPLCDLQQILFASPNG